MICPLTTNKREAIEYAAKLANEYDDCVIAQRYEGKDYTAFVGNTWTTVVTPVYHKDKKYYEIVKAAINEERFYFPDDYRITSLLSAVDYINCGNTDYDKLSVYTVAEISIQADRKLSHQQILHYRPHNSLPQR